MDMNQDNTARQGVLGSPWVAKLAAALLLVATVLVGVQAIKALMNIDMPPSPTGNTITVEGTGKVSAIPDIATISFTVSENGNTASEAQTAATKKSNVALAVVKDLGIEDKDVKTTSYNLSPRYSYQPPCYATYCPPVESHIIGYTVSQTVEIKVHDLDKVGEVLSSLGDVGISNLYGPNFAIDDEDAVRAEARKEAIQEARTKAQVLAKDLKVRLVRIVSFYESGGPVPYYGKAMGLGMGGEAADGRPPEVPAGENEIVVNVSIVYEIR